MKEQIAILLDTDGRYVRWAAKGHWGIKIISPSKEGRKTYYLRHGTELDEVQVFEEKKEA